MTKLSYTLLGELSGNKYHKLLNYAIADCSYALLVLRDSRELDSGAIRFIKRLSPFLYKEERTTEWPGTILFNHEATVFQYYFMDEFVAILNQSVSSLYEWQQPGFPEDLCLLRKDGSPWFVTISHEKDSYFLLLKDELIRLLSAFPDLQPSIENAESERKKLPNHE